MKRTSRLSRSRDFDAVFRHGRSTSSRYLVLYTFPRPGGEEAGGGDGARLGLVVSRRVGGAVERNRVRRRLRSAFDDLRETVLPDRDYVLIVRPGLVEAAESRGFEWLAGQVREVLAEAGALSRAAGP